MSTLRGINFGRPNIYFYKKLSFKSLTVYGHLAPLFFLSPVSWLPDVAVAFVGEGSSDRWLGQVEQK